MLMNNASITLPPHVRILIVKLRGGIGDAILFMPSVRALRETYPDSHIDLLTTPLMELVVKRFNLFDNILVSPSQVLSDEFLHTLFLNRYDSVVFFQRLLPFNLSMMRNVALATGATWRVGLDNGHGDFLNVKVHDGEYGIRHQAEYNMSVVEAIGAVVRDKGLFFPLDDNDSRQARNFLWGAESALIHRPVIAMHPGCGSYMQARRWAPERFAQLADLLYHEFEGQLLLLGGPEEFPLREQVRQTMISAMPTKNISGQESILFTAALIKECDLFIGNDSGLMHISTAVGTTTLGIFGLTNHKAWGPYTPADAKRSMVVRLDLPCMPCAYRGHDTGSSEGCSTRDCLNELSVEVVAKAACSLLYENFERERLC